MRPRPPRPPPGAGSAATPTRGHGGGRASPCRDRVRPVGAATDARETGRRSLAVAASIVWRVVGGMPDDLLWVRTQRLAMRGQRADRKESVMNPHGNSLARWWWVAGAAVIAAFYLRPGIDNLVGDYAPLPESAAQCFIYLAILLVGIACSYKHRAPAQRSSPWVHSRRSSPGGPHRSSSSVSPSPLARSSSSLASAHPGSPPRAGAVLGGILLGAAAIFPMAGLGRPIHDGRSRASRSARSSSCSACRSSSRLALGRRSRLAHSLESPTLVV